MDPGTFRKCPLNIAVNEECQKKQITVDASSFAAFFLQLIFKRGSVMLAHIFLGDMVKASAPVLDTAVAFFCNVLHWLKIFKI